jgi:hypothetical protein
MRRVILQNTQSPGDIVMLTAAVRDLKRALGAAVAVDVRTPCPALWENSPHLTPRCQSANATFGNEMKTWKQGEK